MGSFDIFTRRQSMWTFYALLATLIDMRNYFSKKSKLVLFKNRNILNVEKSIDFSLICKFPKNSTKWCEILIQGRQEEERISQLGVFSILFFRLSSKHVIIPTLPFLFLSLILNESAITHLDFDDTAPRKKNFTFLFCFPSLVWCQLAALGDYF